VVLNLIGTPARRTIAALLSIVLLTSNFAFGGSAKSDRDEPTEEIIRSGSCVVDVCTAADMGGYTFLFYSKVPSTSLQFITKGSCRCNSIKPTSLVRDYIVFSSFVRDGREMQQISVTNEGPRHHAPITAELFAEKKGQFEEVSDFHPDGDHLAAYRVYRSRTPVGAWSYDYFLVPRDKSFSFKGEEQPVAFRIPNGLYVGPPLRYSGTRTPTFAARVRLYGAIRLSQFFSPRLISSEQWIDALELSAEAADSRLFPKR
jgi:hypothetical protein